MRTLALLATFLLLFSVPAWGRARTVPLRVDFAPGTPEDLRVPVRGGIPFSRSAVRDAEHVRVLAGCSEIESQIARTAVWPDGSVKWVLVDLVLAPEEAHGLRLEFGEGVVRRPVTDPLETRSRGGSVSVAAPRLSATVDTSGGLVDLVLGGRKAVSRGDPVRIVLHVKRGDRMRWGKAVFQTVEVETAGPIRSRVLARGYLAVEGWGVGYPARVLAEQPAERVPFFLRIDLVRGLPLALLSHRIVYTGEPDEDWILRWGLAFPGLNAGRRRVIRAPGFTEDREDGAVTVDEGPDSRLCWAPLDDGFALIRNGFENRPTAVGGLDRDPSTVDFHPPEAGPWDLRRYAREWAVGETGQRDRPADMERYARVAAYGMAKTHDVVLDMGGGSAAERLGRARALAVPALLVAPPAWYARSGALGRFAPEDPDGLHAELDRGVRRYLDWFRFNQDLYRWYGPLAYGFWQTRNGDIHRHDRWDRDYGRWGWSLDDGAGRIGHVLMLTYLRTLDRRYLTAGAAFNRVAYDTAMVHTERHLENATDSWWRVKGGSHRHGVQPFSGPYIGLRGSYPEGARIERLLTGDGVLGDDLAIVAAAARDYVTTRPGAFGASGGSDGQGSGALALLHAYETTGDRANLDACRAILDRSGLIPPAAGKRLGYGPSFGLFGAASEYLDLTKDEAFRDRFLALADLAAAEEKPETYLVVLAHALRLTGKDRYRDAIRRALAGVDVSGSLAELPPIRWPGHGGPRRPPSRANVGRDLPYAFAALGGVSDRDDWPRPTPDPVTLPTRVPDDWWRPGGHQTRRDRLPRVDALLKPSPPKREGELAIGPDRLVVARGRLAVHRGEEDEPVAVVNLDEARFGAASARIGAAGRGPSGKFAIGVRPVDVHGVPAARFEVGVEKVGNGGEFEIVLALALADRPGAIQLHAAGAFRTERWRVDMNDEVIPEWLNSDNRTRWPIWRGGGLVLGNAGSYRIFRRNRPDTAPVFVDEGFGAPGWLDVIDRGGETAWGLTVRLLRNPDDSVDDVTRSVLFDHEKRELRVRFVWPAGREFVGAFDVIVHDGWRPPLGPPDLTRAQYFRLLDDLDRDGNIGLFALRHLLSTTHQVGPGDWKTRLADRGIEPRELLLGMVWRDGLRKYAERVGVRYDPDRPDATVRKIIEHHRR